MNNPLLAVHPATWISAGCTVLLLALAPLPLIFHLILLIFLSCLFICAGLAGTYARFALLGMGPVALIAFLVQAVSYQGNRSIWFSYTPVSWMHFSLGPQGLIQGLTLALQILLFGSAFALIALPNSPEKLRVALHRWKVPPRAVFLLVASINAPTLLRRTIHTVQESQRMRGLADQSLMDHFRLLIQASGAMMNLILIENEGRTTSLHQRGIEAPERVLLRDYPDSQIQKILRLVLPLVGVFVAALAILGKTHG